MSDLVSVVVPVYNVERYLDKCIESIVNQTYRNLEIILVDDGSPDNSPAICDEWARKDDRIKVIHKENQGAGLARNAGIDLARGKYICFFDSDDYADTTLIEKCFATMGGEEADLVWYSMADVTDKGEVSALSKSKSITRYSSNKQATEILLPRLISFDYREEETVIFALAVWSGMFSMDIIRKNNLRFISEREIASEDTYFILEYFNYVNSVVTTDEILYYHYINTVSLSTTYKADRQKKIDEFVKILTELSNKLSYSDEVRIRILMLYHSFTIATLKLLTASDLPKREKRRLSVSILKNHDLQRTLTSEALKREKRTLRLFFKLASMKLFGLCNLLLRIKNS